MNLNTYTFPWKWIRNTVQRWKGKPTFKYLYSVSSLKISVRLRNKPVLMGKIKKITTTTTGRNVHFRCKEGFELPMITWCDSSIPKESSTPPLSGACNVPRRVPNDWSWEATPWLRRVTRSIRDLLISASLRDACPPVYPCASGNF